MTRHVARRAAVVHFIGGLTTVACGSSSQVEEQTGAGGDGRLQVMPSGGASGETGDEGDGDAPALSSGGVPGAGGVSPNTPGDPSSTDCRVDGDRKTTLVFENSCVDSVEFRGSDIEGGTISPGGVACVDIGSDVETISSKRYRGFIGDDPGGQRHTLAEFTFNTDFYDFDWYNISHVDAHNLPMRIVPVARPDCKIVTCAESWLETCPEIGKLRDSEGEVIACVSPERDNPNSEVALFFEGCDDAYAWSGDDQAGDDPSPMYACAGEDWDIVFCPEEK